ncbi:MAG: hypothetical protein WAV98_01545 [Minisyncoccia bacterium]
MNSHFVGDTLSLSLKKEVAKVVQCAECSITEEAKGSYIVTSTGGNYLSSAVPSDGNKETEDRILLHERANAEDLLNLQNSINNLSHNAVILVQDIGIATTPQKEVFTEGNSSILISPFAKEAR